MAALSFTIDVSKLTEWAGELSRYTIRLAAKNAINRTARRARNEAIKTIATDIGVSTARVKKSVSALRAASPWNLKAEFTASAQRIGILNVTGARVLRLGGLTASTYRLTGGGSSSLNVAKAFRVKANGGTFVAVRKGGSRLPLKGIYAEHPATALGQKNAAARQQWQKVVDADMPAELSKGFQAVLDGMRPPADSGSNT